MPQPYLTEEWRVALTTFLLGSVGQEGANVPSTLFFTPQDQRRQDIQNGWWVIKKYNCMGCHEIQVGQRSVVQNLPFYSTPEGKDLLPPRLTSEGARVDPGWLLRFLHDPSMSGEKTPGQQQQINTLATASPAPQASLAAGSAGQQFEDFVPLVGSAGCVTPPATPSAGRPGPSAPTRSRAPGVSTFAARRPSVSRSAVRETTRCDQDQSRAAAPASRLSRPPRPDAVPGSQAGRPLPALRGGARRLRPHRPALRRADHSSTAIRSSTRLNAQAPTASATAAAAHR